ncbi:methyl-accepting chemotaxis protein [Pyxidicoccus fallax]|uniref:HAMP domain-containing protein n=1 Tax=Pyxidicoccus fallax TaxID=394095 RepID=A0A848LDD7_9BACT|nr:methyl-accepting chemotaxis protein [Pyxidicoccus fallax]NMO17100.1 HAMP domain-containing protein [Pyxidicoccus fallax]NPC78835.1 methyl-accepting chemotaxis protein [Pyxidicoccus fallax]
MHLPLIGSLTLRGRLTLYVTLLCVIPLLALNVLQTRGARRMVEEQIRASLLREAEGVKDLMEATLAEREASLRSWAEDVVVRSALRTGNTQPADALLALLQRRYLTLNGIVLFNDEGHAISASTPALRDAYAGMHDVRETAWFREAQQGRTTGEGVTAEDPVFGVRVLSLAVPVVDPATDTRLGVLLAAFDWAQVDGLVQPALARARQRSLDSFALALRRADGAVLFDTRGKDAGGDGELLAVEAVNGTAVKDVGDGWRFVALVDPDEAYAPVDGLRTVAMLMALGFGVLAVAGAWLLARGITRPVLALRAAVTRIVREGDLTRDIDVKAGDDEVGELAGAFGQLVKQLRESVRSMQSGTRVLSETVAELQRASEQQERNVARQATALQETQVTAQEIKQTSLLASEKAEDVLGRASRAEEVGREGEEDIRDSLGGFQSLLEQSKQMTERISQLNERTRQIGGITGTVKDLADQSNMLALNAAIEAARSGEHGKGFGVVAREIRNLADQSIQATERVRDILNDLGGSILSTAKMTEAGHARVEAGVEQVRSSGERLKELATIIQDNAAAVRQIAGAVSQQNAGIAQIFTAVTDLSSMMSDTQQSLAATTRAAKLLQEVSGQMQDVARAYRT